MLVNVAAGVRVLLVPLGASGGRKRARGAEARLALALVIALYQRLQRLSQQPWGYFWRDGCAVVLEPGAPGPGRGGATLSSGSPTSACSSRARRATILSPWVLVSLVAGRGHSLSRVGLGRFGSGLEGTSSRCAGWWGGEACGQCGTQVSGPGVRLRAPGGEEPQPGAQQATQLTAALPFQGRARRSAYCSCCSHRRAARPRAVPRHVVAPGRSWTAGAAG